MNDRFFALCGELAERILDSSRRLTVIAVHSKSVYMRLSDGRLLLLCPDSYGRVPFGAAISDYEQLRSRREYTEGECVTLDRGTLCFSDGYSLTLVRREADPTADVPAHVPSEDVLLFAQRYAYEHASRRGMVGVLGVMICNCVPFSDATAYALAAASEADRLERGLLLSDSEALSFSLRKFIGLGYGLTPSGDDFVCGMAYVFCRYKKALECADRYLSLLRDGVLPILDRTGEVSREYIMCALDGERFDVVDDVLDCFALDDSSDAMLRSLERLLGVGASSGSDILCGMLFAFYLLKQGMEEI